MNHDHKGMRDSTCNSILKLYKIYKNNIINKLTIILDIKTFLYKNRKNNNNTGSSNNIYILKNILTYHKNNNYNNI